MRLIERHELIAERGADERAAAEPHNGEAGGKTGAVRKPFDQGRDRGNVAQSQTNTAYDAIAEIDQQQAVHCCAGGGDLETEPKTKGRIYHGPARPYSFEPRAK